MFVNNIINLQIGNTTQIETVNDKTEPINMKQGVLQGAPLSPTLYHLSVDHVLEIVSEITTAEKYGYKTDDLPAISEFADDTVLVGKDCQSAIILYSKVKALFE